MNNFQGDKVWFSLQPFNKEELNTILKFGAEELFKEVDGEEQDLLDFDIDDFLSRAETHEESDQPQTVGEELLAGFKVANFNYDDDDAEEENEDEHDDKEKQWEDIIPQTSRDKVAMEEETKAQSEMFLPPRQRTKVRISFYFVAIRKMLKLCMFRVLR